MFCGDARRRVAGHRLGPAAVAPPPPRWRRRGRAPQGALAISDPDNPYRYIQIRGKVVEITEEGAYDMIDHLSDKYRGEPFDHAEGEVRVTYRILPESVQPKG